MKKKFLLSFVLALISIFALGAVCVSAAQYGDLTYTVSNGRVTITDCDTSVTEVTIPQEIDGCPVTSIGDDAFYNCSSLTSITILDGVTSFGKYAFYGCSNLTSISITDSVTSIGNYAFLGCSSLVSITIPNSITSIGSSVFSGCSSLTSISIPNSVTSIGEGAFSNCSSLTNVTIPNSVTSIGNSAFSGCNSLTSISIPESITSISEMMFGGCRALVSITMPDSITSIGEKAFYCCVSLANIIIPDSVTSIGKGAFYVCNSLISIKIPDGITNIDDGTFSNCSSLVSVKMPESVTHIGIQAFYNCNNLINITIPKGVTIIGDGAFFGCSSLVDITIPDYVNYIGYSTFSDCSSLRNINIPNSVTYIDDSAFSECKNLRSITMSNSIESIGFYAFSNCYNLEKVYITDINSWYKIWFGDITSNPLYYGATLYLNQEPVTEIAIPDGIIKIKNYAFYNCNGLTSVKIPDSVTSIGDYAFYSCDNLISLSVGSGVTTIPQNAFYSCQNLKYVCLPKELLYIRNDAFNDCPNIEKVFYAGSEDEWNNILKYNRNENLTTKEIIYNAAKRTYKFDTGCDAAVSEITDYAVFVQLEAENGDKKLEGWYDNKNFSGSPVVFPYYGSAETLYAKWTDKTGLGFDDAFTAEANREYTVTTTDVGQTIYYEFVPRFTGEYRFFSKGSLDIYGYLYNSDRKRLVSDNNSGEENNFKIAYNLTAGEKYYIAVNCLSDYGQFMLAMETDCVESTKTVCVTATTGEKIFITIPKYLPQNARIILACYKGEKFVEMKSAPNTDETVYFIVNTDFDFAKVMVWDSIGTMIPVCHAEDVDKIS